MYSASCSVRKNPVANLRTEESERMQVHTVMIKRLKMMKSSTGSSIDFAEGAIEVLLLLIVFMTTS